MTNKQKIRIIIRLIEKTDCKVWDYVTMKYCDEAKFIITKQLLSECGIVWRHNNLISTHTLRAYLNEY